MAVEIIRETVNGERRKEIYEIGVNRENEFECISIYILTPEAPVLTIHGNNPVEKYINLENVPKDVEIVRFESKINSGVVFTDENTTIVRVFAPLCDILRLNMIFNRIALEVLEAAGIHAKLSTHRPGANDLVFVKDGTEKKFSGRIADFSHCLFSFFFCFDFNHEAAEGLYKLDTHKMKKRGNIKSTSDIIGGLREISPNAGPDLIDDIVEKIILELNPKWNGKIK
jgi:hypothetical protein